MTEKIVKCLLVVLVVAIGVSALYFVFWKQDEDHSDQSTESAVQAVNEIRNPSVPFFEEIPVEFRPNFMVRIKGKISGDEKCGIDFLSSPGLDLDHHDLMFHFSLRLGVGEEVIVRNSYIHGQWGEEERDGKCLIKKDQPFEIDVIAESQYYKIVVNGQLFGVFRHRMPLHLVRFVRIITEVPDIFHVANLSFDKAPPA